MSSIDIDEHIDTSQWVNWSDADPMVKPERRGKGDILFEVDCSQCNGNGKDNVGFCKPCMGRGRIADHRPLEEAITDIRYAQVQIRNILNFLWQEEIITQQNHDDGHAFEAWRNQHRVAIGLQKPVSSEITDPSGTKLRAYGYVLLIQRLAISDQHAVQNTIDTPATNHTKWLALRNAKFYPPAFSRLSAAFIPVREQIVYLESLPEAERETLSDERLKKMLAEIKKCR